MFKLENDVLFVTLPEGKTQGDLISMCKEEVKGMEQEFYGKSIKVNGRLTTGMALYLGHALAHICKSVSIFDPKEGVYFMAVTH